MTMTFTAGNPAGKRLVSVKVNGIEISDDEDYRIAGCERAGEPMHMICRLKGARDVKIEPTTIHEGLLRYLERNPVVSVQRQKRSVATDLPERVFSQDEVLTAMKSK